MFTAVLLIAATTSAADQGCCFRRHRCNPAPCCTTTVVMPGADTKGGGTGTTDKGSGKLKMSKDVQDLINGDADIKKAFDGIPTTAEKQKFADTLQKTFDDEAKKAKDKMKDDDKDKNQSFNYNYSPYQVVQVNYAVEMVASRNNRVYYYTPVSRRIN